LHLLLSSGPEAARTIGKFRGEQGRLKHPGDRRIYEESAPLISSAMKPLAQEFLIEVIKSSRRGPLMAW
jgi:hypothetical protein